jgi:hypothetical protein
MSVGQSYLAQERRGRILITDRAERDELTRMSIQLPNIGVVFGLWPKRIEPQARRYNPPWN